MDEIKTCEHCGAKMKMWKHNLTSGLIEILVKFIEAVKQKGKNDIHLQTEISLTKNQYNNFQKLRYFGLVAKVKDENGNHKAGHWIITRNGGEFLRSKMSMPRWVMTFRNKIEKQSDERVYINSLYAKNMPMVWFQNEFDFEINQGKLL